MPTRKRRPRSASASEKKIKAIHARRLKHLAEADACLDELAEAMKEGLAEGEQATHMGTLLKDDERPNGMTRQYVYKLIKERAGKTEKPEKIKVTIRPRPKA